MSFTMTNSARRKADSDLIESLRAELAAEREKSSSAEARVRGLESTTTEAWANDIREKLAASQLSEQRLRRILESLLKDDGLVLLLHPDQIRRIEEAVDNNNKG